MGWLQRAIRPPDPIPTDAPGDPHGVVFAPDPPPSPPPPRPVAQPWAGWPAEWDVPPWNGSGPLTRLTDTAWTCIDLNAGVLASMPPYLVGANPAIDAAWLENPDPDLYTSWDEFAKQLFWDYQLGEVFVLATARYATGYPARFHVVPGWTVNVEMDSGRRRYSIGSYDVTPDLLHVRYQSTTADAHGHGPLEVGAGRLVASSVLARYAAGLASSGGVPTSILTHPEELRPEQTAELQQQWIAARTSNLGAPAVLSGGIEWKATQLNPRDMALVELASWNDARIAVLLGVPPFLAGLPSGGDSMTYSNVTSLFDYHWRAGLRPKAQAIMGALSGWLLPRGTLVEVNRDAYVRPGPLERAQTYQILNALVDQQGNPAITVQEIRDAERLDERLPAAVMRG
jgi:HK97 family phage portal protein